MPSQSRGYWSCDYCGMEGFDTYDDAKVHEIEDCQHRKRPAEPERHETAYPGPQSLIPFGQPPMMEAPPEATDYPEDPRYQMQPQYYPRRLPLLMPGSPHDLSMSDAATCSMIEVMEATPDLVNAANVRRTERTMVSPGQVVMRCIQCVRNPASVHSTPQLFPNSISSMASSVRSLQDHLRVCAMVPDDVKRTIGPSVAKGRRALEEEEQDRMALIDYCTNFCRQEGIFNKHPPNSGIVFSEMEEPNWSQAYGGHPESGRGMSPSYAPQYPTPQRAGMPTAMPMGSDPMSTPMGSRRARPPSDRGEGYPPPPSQPYSGGYAFQSSPYSTQFGGPPRPELVQYGGRERSFGTEEAPTPIYSARYEQGPEYPPHPMESTEALPLPPPGYVQLYELPPDFPFVQEPGGTWECRFCSHVHPQYRDPQSIWSAPGGGPPPAPFMDQHLSMCRAYNTPPPPPPPYPGPPTPYPFIPIHPQPAYSYGWEAPGQPPGPPPEQRERSPPRPGVPLSLQPPQPQTPYSQPPPTRHSREIVPRHPSGTPASGPTPRTPGHVAPEPFVGDREMERAKIFLASADKPFYGGPLVLDEDKLLLTDYFFHLMKQLKLCRFSEADRKTRGGKRDKIRLGYGGLQCVHCSDTPNGRKFFWSNVDRLANSFAEIPGHLFKCRRCPQPTKDALLKLKARHAEQMARLPRGSQKVFFRRMWRRLHDEDPQGTEGDDVTPTKEEFSPSTEETRRRGDGDGWGDDSFDRGEDTPKHGDDESRKTAASHGGSTETESLQRKPPPVATGGAAMATDTEHSPATSGSESVILIERTSQEAARALAATDLEHPAPPSPSSRVLLAIPEDKEWLSDMDCFMRRQVEVFCASSEDVLAARSDRKYPVTIGQIGIRCIHCALSKPRFGARGTAVAFPFAINGIFESVRELGRTHLESCENMPKSVKDRLVSFRGSSSLSSVLRKYYILAAKALGLYDTPEGIRAGAESVPLGPQAAFAFSPDSTQLSEQLLTERSAAIAQEAMPTSDTASGTAMATTPMESRKRTQPSQGERSPKEAKTEEEEPFSPNKDGEPV